MLPFSDSLIVLFSTRPPPPSPPSHLQTFVSQTLQLPPYRVLGTGATSSALTDIGGLLLGGWGLEDYSHAFWLEEATPVCVAYQRQHQQQQEQQVQLHQHHNLQ